MATHDYVIANQSGASFRTDLNNALAAIVSNNSSSSTPSTTYAYQWWADTSNGILKLRNSGNSAWIDMLNLDGTNDFKTTGATVATFQRTSSTSNVAMEFKNDTSSMFIGLTASATGFAVDDDNALGTAPMFFVERSTGNCAIGTNSPSVTLDIEAATPVIRLTDSDASGTPECQISGGGGDLVLIADRDDEKASTLMQFQTDGSTAMTIDSSQQVIIGTTSSVDVASTSGALLQVEHSSGNISAAFYSTVSASAPSGVLALGHGRGSAAGALIDNDVLGEIRFAGGDGTDCVTQGAVIRAQVDGSPSSNNMPAELRFFTNSGSASVGLRMIIDKSGNIGAPSGTNIYNASDLRLKKNVVDLDKGLSAIKSLRPVSFNWIDGFCDDEKNTLYGFIAQEVETIDRNLIQEFGNGSVTVEGQTINDALRVNEKLIIPVLVKAVQELEAKVAALEAA